MSLEIAGIGRIWLNPTRSSRIWSRSRRIRLDFAGFGRIFLYNSGRVRVARVLEKQTRHSTRRCRFLRTETRRRPTGPSIRAGIGSASGGLAGLSGSDRVWTALHERCFLVCQMPHLMIMLVKHMKLQGMPIAGSLAWI